ncbi:hypothetical protein Tco_1184912 [Tanacetum coccineum]
MGKYTKLSIAADRLLAERLVQTESKGAVDRCGEGKIFIELWRREEHILLQQVTSQENRPPYTTQREIIQKTDENEAVKVDNEVELKEHMVTVKDDDIAIDAIPLTTKPPVIVEYKLIREGIMAHYQLISSDGSFKRYSSMD